jgi:hypothetical protein
MRFSSLRSSFTFCPTKVPVDFPGVTVGGTKLVFPRTGGAPSLASGWPVFLTLAEATGIAARGGAEILELSPRREGHKVSGHKESIDVEHADSAAAEKMIVRW